MIKTVEINERNYQDYEKLVPPAYLKKLKTNAEGFKAFGIQLNGKSIGVAITEIEATSKEAKVPYFEVRTEENFSEVIQLLLDRIELYFIERGIGFAKIYFTFTDNNETVEKLFKEQNWQLAPDKLIKYIGDPQKVKSVKWKNRLDQENHFQIVPWSSKEEDLVEQVLTSNNRWFKPEYSPLYERERIDREMSSALYDGDNLVGWIICEKVASNMILGKNFFVKEMDNKNIAGMKMLGDFIERMINSPYYLTFFVKGENQSVNNIVYRRVKESIIQVKNVYKYTKTF